jgi:hypothetical protein
MVVFSRLIVTRMTTCTSIGVGRVSPRNCLTVTRMTGITGQAYTMISRIVTGSMAVVCHRQPSVYGVAVITLHSSDEMPLGLTGGG